MTQVVSSVPESPYDVLDYFNVVEVRGDKYYYINEDGFFVLEKELKRYIEECESCPNWDNTEKMEGLSNDTGKKD